MAWWPLQVCMVLDRLPTRDQGHNSDAIHVPPANVFLDEPAPLHGGREKLRGLHDARSVHDAGMD